MRRNRISPLILLICPSYWLIDYFFPSVAGYYKILITLLLYISFALKNISFSLDSRSTLILLALSSWACGVIFGLVNSYDKAIVFTHYSGIIAIIVYFLLQNYDANQIYQFVRWMFAFSFFWFLAKALMIYDGDLTDRLFYYHPIVWWYVYGAVLIANKPANFSIKITALICFIILANYLIQSKALTLLNLILLFILYTNVIVARRQKIYRTVYLLILPALIIFIFFGDLIDNVNIFSLDLAGNSKRFGYIMFYISNASFIPMGIGAPVGVLDVFGSREIFYDPNKVHVSYSELLLLDYPYKTGILGYLFLTLWVFLGVRKIKKFIITRTHSDEIVSACAFIVVMAMGIGNPSLFSFDSIFLISLCLVERRGTSK